MPSSFALLQHATVLHTEKTAKTFNLVEDWTSKREMVTVLLHDLPIWVANFEAVTGTPLSTEPRIKVEDTVPRVRLMAMTEATVSALYGLADVSANVAARVTHCLPSSFNKIRKKIRDGEIGDPLKSLLGDLVWYERIREIRTEWSHHSSVFVVKGQTNQTEFTLRDYRRPSDQTHFKQLASFTSKQLIDWTSNAITTLDGLAEYLATQVILPSYDPDAVITSPVYDETGFPKMHPDGRFETKQITIREFFRDRQIDLNDYRPARE